MFFIQYNRGDEIRKKVRPRVQKKGILEKTSAETPGKPLFPKSREQPLHIRTEGCMRKGEHSRKHIQMIDYSMCLNIRRKLLIDI